jgi:hypothetical protein
MKRMYRDNSFNAQYNFVLHSVPVDTSNFTIFPAFTLSVLLYYIDTGRIFLYRLWLGAAVSQRLYRICLRTGAFLFIIYVKQVLIWRHLVWNQVEHVRPKSIASFV